MTRSILKPIVAGLFIGAAAFFLPGFLFGVLLFMLIARIVFFRRMSRGRLGQRQMAFVDRVRAMTDEEYTQFKEHSAMWNYHDCSAKRNKE